MCCAHMNRRQFLGVTTTALAGASLAGAGVISGGDREWAGNRWNPDRPLHLDSRPLRVLPVLMYRVATPREQTSWKSWGAVQTAAAGAEEAERIQQELAALAGQAGFPLEVLPVTTVRAPGEAQRLRDIPHDATIVYPASGSGETLRACIQQPETILFARHQSGPVYYWYESLSTRYLRPLTETPRRADDDRILSVEDVVIDNTADLLWRLRALHGVHNLRGAKIVAVGGPMGKYAPDAPEVARDRYGIDIVDVGYDEVEERIAASFASAACLDRAESWTARYLGMNGTDLRCDRPFVVNAFVLYGVFKDLLEDHGASLFTIQQCMSTIMPMARTTACLTLGLLNDEGLGAFCESDFVIIPAGILLRHVSGRPVFLHNSTFPHEGVVTCAHCTAPRRMDGSTYEPAEILTHYESEYGAAPKVAMPLGQEVTCIDPEYDHPRWIGLKGSVIANPNLAICRSQQDIRVDGHWERLLDEVRDSHWVMVYGDCLREMGYAAHHLGLQWENISAA